MSDKKQSIPITVLSPAVHALSDEAFNPTRLEEQRTGFDSLMAQEYQEALLLIYGVRGKFKLQAAGRRVVENVVNGELVDQQTVTWQTEPVAIDQSVPAKPPTLTFTDLARRFSEQMQEVASTGKQITAASRQMASGIQDLNDGVGMLRRKLSRVKY